MPNWSTIPGHFSFDERAQYALASGNCLSLNNGFSGLASDVDDPDQDLYDDLPGMKRWVCVRCEKSSFVWSLTVNNWVCTECHSDQFYDVTQPAKHQTKHGTWVFMPHDSHSPDQSPASQMTDAILLIHL